MKKENSEQKSWYVPGKEKNDGPESVASPASERKSPVTEKSFTSQQ
jgi:hypothetical protein